MSKNQRMVIMRSAEEVQKQLATAWERLEEACEGEMPGNLRALHGVDAEAFSLLIEAMVQLGEPVDQEMQDLAGLKPVDEVLS
ncbi:MULTISPECIES: hypothetical protein [unclassified Streptomyces]|uniref:hypothetical protein n=1 Tax=unclassified Streptomyces TaxID=2593676 RepID=UPI002E2D8E2A|nr:hypothetical protein [Streptomyces sp. NBC_00285]